MYETSGSKFFWTTTGIQSGPGIFDESKLIMALTNLGVMVIIYSFWLFPQGKTGK